MTILRPLKRRQRAWAKSRNIPFDQRGYVPEEAQNFFLPLSPRFSEALDQAGGGERMQQRHLPAKIRALHSSAVPAINPGVAACAWPRRSARSGIDRTPVPHRPARHATHAFAEWIGKKRTDLDRFRQKYRNTGKDLWADAGLPGCQALASSLSTHCSCSSMHWGFVRASSVRFHCCICITTKSQRLMLPIATVTKSPALPIGLMASSASGV